MKRMLAKHGKKGYLLALEHVGPELIDFYPVDAFVNTACPRIAIDDAVKYRKPLITPFELEVALGEKQWETGYQFDEIPDSPGHGMEKASGEPVSRPHLLERLTSAFP